MLALKGLKDRSIGVMRNSWKELQTLLIWIFATHVLYVILEGILKNTNYGLSPLFALPFIIILAIAFAYLSIAFLRALVKQIFPEVRLHSYGNDFLTLAIAGILSGLLTVLGFILLIVPGIWLCVSLSFFSFEVIAHHKGAVDSLKASYALVKGRWFDVFWAGLILFLWMVLLHVMVAIAVVILLIPFSGVTEDVIKAVTSGAISTLTTFFATTWQLLVYKALKETKANPAPEVA